MGHKHPSRRRVKPTQLAAEPRFIDIDNQKCPVRMTRGRKTKHIARVLAAFNIHSDDLLRTESCATWEVAQHRLFWELLGYDGQYWTRQHGLPGMIGESKRLILEVTRP